MCLPVSEELLVGGYIGHLDIVTQHPEEDGLGGVGHEAFASECSFL